MLPDVDCRFKLKCKGGEPIGRKGSDPQSQLAMLYLSNHTSTRLAYIRELPLLQVSRLLESRLLRLKSHEGTDLILAPNYCVLLDDLHAGSENLSLSCCVSNRWMAEQRTAAMAKSASCRLHRLQKVPPLCSCKLLLLEGCT